MIIASVATLCKYAISLSSRSPFQALVFDLQIELQIKVFSSVQQLSWSWHDKFECRMHLWFFHLFWRLFEIDPGGGLLSGPACPHSFIIQDRLKWMAKLQCNICMMMTDWFTADCLRARLKTDGVLWRQHPFMVLPQVPAQRWRYHGASTKSIILVKYNAKSLCNSLSNGKSNPNKTTISSKGTPYTSPCQRRLHGINGNNHGINGECSTWHCTGKKYWQETWFGGPSTVRMVIYNNIIYIYIYLYCSAFIKGEKVKKKILLFFNSRDPLSTSFTFD